MIFELWFMNIERWKLYLSSAYVWLYAEYYTKLVTYDKIYIEQHDHYMKQTYRNRCTLPARTGNSAFYSIIKPESQKCPMKDIRISDHGNWRHMHWNAIESAYNSTPFLNITGTTFILSTRRNIFLADFNEELCHLICQLADIQPDITRTAEYKTDFYSGWIRFPGSHCPSQERFPTDRSGIHPRAYYQVFDIDKMVSHSNLSIIDLLFNMGPESLLILQPEAKANKK